MTLFAMLGALGASLPTLTQLVADDGGYGWEIADATGTAIIALSGQDPDTHFAATSDAVERFALMFVGDGTTMYFTEADLTYTDEDVLAATLGMLAEGAQASLANGPDENGEYLVRVSNRPV